MSAVRVDVVLVRLADQVLGDDLSVLSADERERTARFYAERHRGRYASGRATLRRLLGAHLGCAPSEIEFTLGPFGKPYLHGADTQFNVSHCEDVALIAVADGVAALGVDIELSREGVGGVDIAQRFFSKGEVARLLALQLDERDDAFLRCWTRKEALLKGHGGGLTLPLHDFQVSLEPRRPAAIVEYGPALSGGSWQLHDVSSSWPESHAAVAVDSIAPVSIICTLPEEGNS